MTTDLVSLFYNGREEFLKVLDTNQSLVKYLSNTKNPVCPLMGNEIKMLKTLGRGQSGIVFEIDFPGRGKRRYVAKKTNVDEDLFGLITSHYYRFLDLERMYGIKAEVIIEYNNLTGKRDRYSYLKQTIIVPLFMKGCLAAKNSKYPRNDNRGYVEFNIGDQICDGNYSEFALSVIAGELYRSGRSINFVDVFYFATCANEHNLLDVSQYTFMEKIDGTLKRTLGCIFEHNQRGDINANHHEEAVNSVVVQIIHAIGVYQTYEIVHGDLHDDNVFLEYVTPETQWKGKSVLDVDYYEYKVNGQSIYVTGGRVCPFIVKIGDWGLSVKYKTPRVANKTTIDTGYDQGDGQGPWLPNFYNTSYDLFYIITIIYNLNPSNKFIKSIVSWMITGTDEEKTDEEIYEAIREIYGYYDRRENRNGKWKINRIARNRPLTSELTSSLSHVSPTNILTNKKLMGKYLDSLPSDSHTILFGEF